MSYSKLSHLQNNKVVIEYFDHFRIYFRELLFIIMTEMKCYVFFKRHTFLEATLSIKKKNVNQ